MNKKLPGLHSLRGIAALMIVIFHIAGIAHLELPSELFFINSYFGMGVPLFFVISAFSLYLSTYQKVGTENWVQIYFVKRFFRVAPLFYIMLVFYLIIYYFVFNKSYSFSEIFINLSFLYNLFPGKHESMVWAGWTIGVEMLFYLLLPYLMLNIRSIPRALVWSVFSIMISIAARSMYGTLDLPATYRNMSLLSQLGVFSAGIPTYFIYMRYREHIHAENIGRVLLLSGVLLIAWSVLSLVYFVPPDYMYGIVPLIFSLLILSQLLSPFVLLTNKLFVYMGEISFSLYLLHPMLVYGLRPVYSHIYGYGIDIGLAFLICAVVTLLLLVPIAHIVYKIVETKSIYAGNWLIRNRLSSH